MAHRDLESKQVSALLVGLLFLEVSAVLLNLYCAEFLCCREKPKNIV